MKLSKNLEKVYALLSPTGQSEIWKAEDFWAMAFDSSHEKNTRRMGYLVSAYDFSCDWETWENHPYGDEIVFCISGSMTCVFREEKKTRRIKVKSGEFLTVPKNTWHTAIVHEPTKALFITWGYGTKHQPVTDF